MGNPRGRFSHAGAKIYNCLACLFICSCPVLKELDLGALSKSFLRLELSSCALGCLLMAVTPQEDKIKVHHTAEEIMCVFDDNSKIIFVKSS